MSKYHENHILKLGNAAGTSTLLAVLREEKAMRHKGGLYHQTQDVIIAFHHDFEEIHPFQDGNGRVGRLIAFKECLRFALTPFIIDGQLRLFYYRGLKEWGKEQGYLLDTCKSGQDKYQAIIDYFQKG